MKCRSKSSVVKIDLGLTLLQFDFKIQLQNETGTQRKSQTRACQTFQQRIIQVLFHAVSSPRSSANSWKSVWRGFFPIQALCYTRKLHFILDPPACVDPNPAMQSDTKQNLVLVQPVPQLLKSSLGFLVPVHQQVCFKNIQSQ
jgi:hypothetical protein